MGIFMHPPQYATIHAAPKFTTLAVSRRHQIHIFYTGIHTIFRRKYESLVTQFASLRTARHRADIRGTGAWIDSGQN